MKINYSIQQKQALNAIKSFIKSSDDVFILTGLAGSGKTALIPEIYKQSNTVKVLSATNQGLIDLRYKYGLNVYSIYREFYEHPQGRTNVMHGQVNDVQIKFSLKEIADTGTIFLIDNAELIPNIINNSNLIYGSGKILDDIVMAVHENCNKLIFIGDSYQIKPVTDNKSQALQKNYFEEKGLRVTSFELKDSHRTPQGVMEYVEKLRDEILNETGNAYEIMDNRQDVFCLNRKSESSLEKMKIIARKVATSNTKSNIIITNSMKKAQEYNHLIRAFQRKSKNISIGDILILTKNVYDNVEQSEIIPSGSFIEIVGVKSKKPVIHSIERNGRKVQLSFVQVEYYMLPINDQSEKKVGYLLTNILNSDKSELEDNNLALYIDYFKRHRDEVNLCVKENKKVESDEEHRKHDRRTKNYWDELKKKLGKKLHTSTIQDSHKELQKLLVANPDCDPKKDCQRKDPYHECLCRINEDPFYNCIVAKYGYATTIYRTIGNEWENVYIDFENQNGVKESNKRWAYTALSRSNKRVIILNKHSIFADKFNVEKKNANTKKMRRLQQLSHFKNPLPSDTPSNRLLLKQLFIYLNKICSQTAVKYVGIDTQKIENNFVRYYFQLKSGEIFELQMYFSHKGWSKANVFVRDEYRDLDLKQVNSFIKQLEKVCAGE